MNYTAWQRWDRIGKGGLLFASFVSAVLTYDGVQEAGLGHVGNSWYLPTLLTALAAGWALVVWYFAFDQLPHSQPSQRRSLFGVMVFAAVVILMTSTYYAAIGLGGSRAQGYHLSVSVESGEAVFYRFLKRRQQEEGVLAPLQQAVTVLSNHEKGEIKAGTVSGKAGQREVASQLGGTRNGFQKLREAVEEYKAETSTLRDRGNRLFEELRLIVNDPLIPANEKSARANRLFQQTNSLFISLDTSVLPTIESTVDKIDQMYLVNLEQDVREKMRKILAECKALVRQAMAGIPRDNIQYPRFRVLDAEEAVMTYAWHCRSAFAFAFTADLLLPITLLVLLNFIASKMGVRQQAQTGAGRTAATQFPKPYSFPRAPTADPKRQAPGGNGKGKQITPPAPPTP
jgi:hypothetical protein